MLDPHFDEQGSSRRQLLSVKAAFWLSVGAIGCALCWLTSIQPDAAAQLSWGLGLTIVAAAIILRNMSS
jgi:apolipoprotein N-acyltransferase